MAEASFLVVVPVYNRPTLVLEALDSIAAQTHPPRALRVVDDGSTDGTAEAVEQWLATHDLPFEAELIRQDNAGVSVARNRGAEAAHEGELLAFLDSDDLWPVDFLERMTQAFAAAPDAVAALCDRVDLNYVTRRRRHVSFAWVEQRTTEQFVVRGSVATSSLAMRSSAFRAIGRYDPKIRTGQDYHLALRLSLHGRFLHVPGEPVVLRHNIGTEVAEETALSRAYADRCLIRVRTMEQFLFEDGGKDAVPESIWRRKLSRMWFKAGQQLTQLKRAEEATDCFARALDYRPSHLRARLHLAMKRLNTRRTQGA